MALCPECAAQMPQMAAVCPECGFDFPFIESEFRAEMARTRRRQSFANSKTADVILDLGSVLLAAISILTFLVGVAAIFVRDWPTLVSFLLAASIGGALSIVCARALDWKP